MHQSQAPQPTAGLPPQHHRPRTALATLTGLVLALAAAAPVAAGTNAAAASPPSTVVGTYEIRQVDPPLHPADPPAPGARAATPHAAHDAALPEDATQEFVRLADGDRVRVEADPALLDDVVPGQRVAVTGTVTAAPPDATEEAPTIDATAVRELTAAAAPQMSEEDTAAVVLLRLGDDGPAPMSVDEVRDLVFTGPGAVASFFRESSWSQLDLRGRDRPDGDVYGYLTVPADTPCSAEEQAGIAAVQAAGIDLTGYDRVAFLLDSADRGCWFGGWAYIGGQVSVNLMSGADATRAVLQHELGHNLGLLHASALQCSTPAGLPSAIEEDGGSCRVEEYGDPYDTMGNAYNQMEFSARHKARLGWIAEANVTTVTVSGTYTLAPSEVRTDQPQLLRIPLASGLSYDVDVRRPHGLWDAKVADYPALMDGVTIRRGDGWGASLVDTTPGGWVDDAPLRVGQTFTDRASGVRIHTEQSGPDGAVVHVDLGVAAQAAHLTGTHNGWTPAPMTEVPGAPGTWTAQAQFGAEPDQRFRIEVLPGGGSYGDAEPDGVADAGAADIRVPGAGTYTVTFDLASLRYTVVRDGGGGGGFVSTYPAMTLRGISTGWAAVPMELVADHTWRVTTAFGAHPVEDFLFDVDGTGATVFGDPENDGVAEQGAPNVLMTQGPARYEVTFRDDTLVYGVVRVD
ncbi:zinc-dependent metalloprotease family protein [Cellulomonas sp. NPDC055163]